MKKEISKYILFFIVLFIWCLSLVHMIHPDYDLWARLIVGMSIVENGIVLKQDFYSYTQTNTIWLDHEWGASVFIYLWTKLADLLNANKLVMLSYLKALLSFLTFAIAATCVYIRKPKHSQANNILYFALAIMAVNVVFASIVRCHMFTFLFFALWILILESYRIYNKKWLLYLLPFIMLIWGNTHGGCLSGLGILVIYTIGEFFNQKDFKPYVYTLIISFLTLFINPYGIDYVKFIFTAGTMNREWISEWQSPFSMNTQAIKFIMFFFFMIIIAIIQTIKNKFNIFNCDKTKLLLLIVTAYLALFYAKLIPFFVIISSIFMFDDVFENINQIQIIKKITNPNNKITYTIILLLALTTIHIGYTTKALVINNRFYPYGAVKFLQDNKIEGNLFVEMTYGSYCAYKLYPQNKIFMDGRYEEVYNPNLLLTMKNFIKQEGKNPNEVLTDYNTDIVLLKLPFSQTIISRPNVGNMKQLGWKQIYTDGIWEIYVNPNYPIKEYKNDYIFDHHKIYKELFNTNITKELLKNLK